MAGQPPLKRPVAGSIPAWGATPALPHDRLSEQAGSADAIGPREGFRTSGDESRLLDIRALFWRGEHIVVSRSLRRRLGGAAAVAVLLGGFAFAGPAQATSGNTLVKDLTRSVTLTGVLRHLVALQAISDHNGDNRASGSPGFDRSADYVATLMRLAGYRVTRQPFQFNFCEDTGSSFAQNAPTPTTYVDQTDYDVMDCSGNGTATGSLHA